MFPVFKALLKYMIKHYFEFLGRLFVSGVKRDFHSSLTDWILSRAWYWSKKAEKHGVKIRAFLSMGIGTRMLILARSSKHCRQFKRICCIPCKLIYFPKISFPGPLAGSCVYFTTPKKFSRNCHAVYGLAGRFHYTLLMYFFCLPNRYPI